MTARAVAIVGFAIAITGFTLSIFAITRPPAVPCFEDQAYIVREDRDPANGLTWHCVAIDDLIQAAITAAGTPTPAARDRDLRVLPGCPRISVRRGDPRYDELAIARATCERTGR